MKPNCNFVPIKWKSAGFIISQDRKEPVVRIALVMLATRWSARQVVILLGKLTGEYTFYPLSKAESKSYLRHSATTLISKKHRKYHVTLEVLFGQQTFQWAVSLRYRNMYYDRRRRPPFC